MADRWACMEWRRGQAAAAVAAPCPGRGVGARRAWWPRERDGAAVVSARVRRVTLLVLAMVIMGLADLALTLEFLRAVGMLEANPIAREMIAIGGAGQLVRYKLFTIVLSAGLIYLLRRHRAAERCAWVSVVILLGLSAHWRVYAETIVRPDVFPDPATLAADARWVTLVE